MISPNRWSDLIVDELVRNGVTTFCISSGMRNTPLVLAAAKNPGTHIMTHYDERGAAFYAVGHAKATSNPAVLICTSGTAAANYLPAIVEASYSCTPLVVLTADRPVELMDTGANQTINQTNIYANFVRFNFDLSTQSQDVSPEFILTTIDQAVYRSRCSPSGPVHINCRFAEPLIAKDSVQVDDELSSRLRDWKNTGDPYTTYSIPRAVPDRNSFEDIINNLTVSERGLIVVGELSQASERDIILDLAENLRMPVAACVSSGLRFGHDKHDILTTHYDIFFRSFGFVERYKPNMVLHLGGSVVSKHMMKYIQESGADYIVVNDTPFRQDPIHSVTTRFEMDPIEFCREISGMENSRQSELTAPFASADKLCRGIIVTLNSESEFSNELQVVNTILENLPDRCGLFLGNSMPVRDADACGFTSNKSVNVVVNRGASGIDGNLATVSGFAAGIDKPTVAVIGDLAFLHDLNSLSLISKSSVPITVVVINNDGGGIFSMLPVSESNDHFERLFGTPHSLTFERAAEMFNLTCSKPESLADLRKNCTVAFNSGQNSIIEVFTDRQTNAEEHKRVFDKIVSAIEGLI